MTKLNSERRSLLKVASAIAVSGVATSFGCAQKGNYSSAIGESFVDRDEFVIRGANILSMDASVGDFVRGDVHVRNGVIVAIANEIHAPAVKVMDANGMICMPGFVETHWHLWTSLLRPMMSTDDNKRGYFPVTSALGRHFTPAYHYASVRLGMAEAISAGATTVHNWAHNIASAEHADAELRAMRDMGLRGRFSYGAAQGAPNNLPMDFSGLAKIKSQWMPNDGMLTLGFARATLVMIRTHCVEIFRLKLLARSGRKLGLLGCRLRCILLAPVLLCYLKKMAFWAQMCNSFIPCLRLQRNEKYYTLEASVTVCRQLVSPSVLQVQG